MKHAIVLLANGFEEVEAVTQIDYLRRAGIDVRISGIGSLDIISAHKLRVSADDILSANGTEIPDAVILPGGMDGALNISRSREAQVLTEAVFSAGKLVASICASPIIALARWGLLKGKSFTCYRDMELELEKYSGPAWQLLTEGCQWQAARVIRDGNLITSRGAGTAEEFAFEIIRYLEGNEKAAAIAAAVIAR